MFGKLFNRKKSKPSFNFIENYENRNKYFFRTNPWAWLNEREIYIPTKMDGKSTMLTLDFWSQEIYLDATGQITVSDLIQIACKQLEESNMEIPEDLDKSLIETLESLVYELKIVEFTDTKKDLPKEIADPITTKA